MGKEGQPTPTRQPSKQEKGYQNLLNFLAESTAPIQDPNSPEKNNTFPTRFHGQSEKSFVEAFEMIGKYYGLTDATLTNVAGNRKDRNFDNYTTAYILKKHIKRLYLESSAEVQERYPFKSFEFQKPTPTIPRVIRKGQITSEIEQAVANSATLEELRKTYGPKQIRTARRTLSRRGFTIPKDQLVGDNLIELTETESAKATAQSELNQITSSSQISRLKNAGLIVGLSDVLKKLDIYVKAPNMHNIYRVLQDAGVPIRAVEHFNKTTGRVGYYYIIPSLFTGETQSILQNSIGTIAETKKAQIVQIAGPEEDEKPSTYDFAGRSHEPQYKSLSALINEMRNTQVHLRKNRSFADSLMQNSPIAIYDYNGSLRYRRSDEDQLREHLQMRFDQLGLPRLQS